MPIPALLAIPAALTTVITENGVFNPPLTFNGFLNTIAFKEVFNTVMMSFINGLLFVLNVRFLRWSINRLGMRFRTGGGVT